MRWTGALWHLTALSSSLYTLPHVKHLNIVCAMIGLSSGGT